MLISRRHFCLGLSALAGTSAFTMPGMSLAAADTEKRLLLVILRGGMDGLAAVAPVGDKDYYDARRSLALPAEALLPLDRQFAMHSALRQMHTLYTRGQLLVVHAVASPYRDRSHFDAQDILENGGVKAHIYNNGWLGRALPSMQGVKGVAIGTSVPLVMQGADAVQSWAPSLLPDVDDGFLERVSHMYRKDALLSDALAQAMSVPDIPSNTNPRGARQFIGMMKTAAEFMNKPQGARIGTIDMGGWDTHAGQGTKDGKLTQSFRILAEGIESFRSGLKGAWNHTAVLVITEFGRTVAANGSEGSDHGTGSVAFLAGGGVHGGRVLGDWPGLKSSALYENRDLYPANDLRSLCKGVLKTHLGIAEDALEKSIFPGSATAIPLKGLFV
jgi:uncharacterized protein (DUF1501 family)